MSKRGWKAYCNTSYTTHRTALESVADARLNAVAETYQRFRVKPSLITLYAATLSA